MQIVDIRTLSLVCSIVLVVVSIAFGVAALNFRRSSHDTAWWGCGFLFQGAGFLLLFLRGQIPFAFSGTLANTLLVAGLVMLSWGVDVYAEERPRHARGLVWTSVSAILFIVVTYGQPSYNVRVIAVSAILMGINTAIAVRLLRLRNDVRLQQFLTAGMFLVSGAAMGARCLLSMFGPTQDGLFAVSPASVIGFLNAFIMPVFIAIGLLSMVARKTQVDREKTIGELEAALGRVETLSGLLPICASCKKIRDGDGRWHEVEVYVGRHSKAGFSHTLCPSCVARLYPELSPAPEEPRQA